MNKKYKIAMAIALATTSIAYSIGSLFAQSESTISENNLIDTTDENIETEVLESKEDIQNIERAAGDVVINEANFPDPAFRERLSNGYYATSGYIRFDTNRDGILSSDEINNITSIDIGFTNIASAKGIEHFSNLRYLYCSNTNITELDVSKNTALINLDCYNTGITELDVSNNTALKNLNCYNTGITELDVSNNTALTNLNCYNTGIT